MMLKLIAVVALAVIVLALMLIGVLILKKRDDELILNEKKRNPVDYQSEK